MSLQQLRSNVYKRIPDKYFVTALYLKLNKRLPNFKNPVTFTEKIQWLKVYGRMERYAEYADKYTVRGYVSRTIGEDYLVPLVGAWDSFDEIPFDTLPRQFVLKVSHGCGYNVICKDKSALDMAALRIKINGWLNENFYTVLRETQYKTCRPKIICEAYMEDETGSLRDYKIWCAKGMPTLVQVDTDRFTSHKSDIFDPRWNKLDNLSSPTFGLLDRPIGEPEKLSEMLYVARQLSKKIPFVRVDLYCVNNKIYVGELTFTPGSGFTQFGSRAPDIQLGTLIDLTLYK